MSSKPTVRDIRKLHQDFLGASLKLQRAKSYIDEFDALARSLNRPDANHFVIKDDPEHGKIAVFDGSQDKALLMGATIGDAVHNLRCIFDHIWTSLERDATGKQTRATFPFHETRHNVKDAIRKSPVKSAFPKTETLVLDELKPHSDEGGDSVLWSLTRLDNLDKHNMIIPIYSISAIQYLAVKRGTGWFGMSNTVISGDNAIAFSAPDGGKFQQHGRVTVTPCFDYSGPLPRKAILPSLIYLAQATEKAISLFGEYIFDGK